MKRLFLAAAIIASLNCFGQSPPTKNTDIKKRPLYTESNMWDGTPKRIDADSSRWMLYKIDKGVYNYFQSIWYGLQWPSGWSDAVAYYERRYKTDSYLYDWCKVTDTIPTKVNASSSEYSWIEWYVGGDIGGVCIRRDTLDSAIYYHFNEKDSIKYLNGMCHYFGNKPKKVYLINKDGTKKYFEWEVCTNLTPAYYSLEPIKNNK